jgi:hypothetical protein
MAFAGIKILLTKLFDFDTKPYLWLKYSLFYVVAYGIYGIIWITTDVNGLLIFVFIGILASEMTIFFFQYYFVDNEIKYGVFTIFSSFVNWVLFQLYVTFLFTILVLAE